MYDGVDSVTEYAKLVVSGKKLSCKAEIGACRRHLRDLERTDLVWNPAEAEKHIEFAGMLTYFDNNEKKRKPVELRGFEKFILGSLFGWYTPQGIRRFTEAYCQLARKNGKTFLCGVLAVDFALLSGIERGEIYTAGENYDNAMRTYKAVEDFIEGDPELAEMFKVSEYKKEIVALDSKTKIKALSGERGGNKDGLLSMLNIIDEYHSHPTDEIYNVLLDSQVGLQNALTIAITTAGFNLNGPCYKQYKYAKNIALGISNDDSLFAYITELDLPDSHSNSEKYESILWDEREWAKANPLLLFDDDCTITKDPKKWQKIRSAGAKARVERESTERNFITKKLNVWTTISSESYVDLEDWEACGSDKTIADFVGCTVFIGADLSSKNDLTSWSMVIPPQDGVVKPYVWSMSYLPRGTLEAHIRRDRAPYDSWYKEGWLKLTDCGGRNAYILDHKFFIEDMKEYISKYKLKVAMIGYDPMGISGVLSDLEEICEECVEIGQYPKSMNDATRNFKGTVKGRGLEYDKTNKLLTYSIMNAQAVVNSKKEMLIDKKDKNQRIDPIDSLLNSWKCAMTTSDMLQKKEQKKQNLRQWLSFMKKL